LFTRAKSDKLIGDETDWLKEKARMNLHKNARTCPKSRALMVSRVLEDRRPVAEVAMEMGVSRRTVYKWVQRYCAGGKAALQDGSSEPGVLHHQLGQDWVKLIVELRTEYQMTALRIARQLALARSTVAAVLQREGISQLKKLAPKEPVVRYERDGPGEMLHMDIKKLGRFWRPGHRVTGDTSQDSAGAGWEFVHVCVDDYSRVAYAEVLPDERKESAVAFLQRAVRWFSQFGIKIQRVLTDNGSCYQSKLWHSTCKKLNLRVKKTRPYRPQTNGKAERFIQTLLREWAYFRAYSTSNERMAVLPIYLRHYNEHREHGSVNSKPPITRMPGVYNVAGIHS
jgi:transposase InsO family protein